MLNALTNENMNVWTKIRISGINQMIWERKIQLLNNLDSNHEYNKHAPRQAEL